MSYNSSGTRKKPKKADFIYKGVRYWICSYDSIELWDGEYDCMTEFDVKEYETDKKILGNDPLWEDDEFYYSKVRKTGFRVFSEAGTSDMYPERYY